MYCESEPARKSKYVTMERKRVGNYKRRYQKTVWKIDTDLPEPTTKRKAKNICYKPQVYISYLSSPGMRIIVRAIKNELRKQYICVWDRYELLRLNENSRKSKGGYALLLSAGVRHILERGKGENWRLTDYTEGADGEKRIRA